MSHPDRRHLLLTGWQEIPDLTSVAHWRREPTACNPANPISRGTSPLTLTANTPRWKGPQRLALQPSSCSSPAVRSPSNYKLLEQRVCLVASPEQPEDITTRFSKHYRLIRTIAYCLRFAVNCKVKKEESRVHLPLQKKSTEHYLSVYNWHNAVDLGKNYTIFLTLKKCLPRAFLRV